ncbi:MAG: hypothetical protein NOM71_01395 [Archaeoglobi archaeon]|nr:hypothetical protein [Archaeoglobi archaeon]
MKKMLIAALCLLSGVFLLGCSETGSFCRADREGASCSLTSDGLATLQVDLPKEAWLQSAEITGCEVTGKLWSCPLRGSGCEIMSEKNPFKAKCPISGSGNYSVIFRIENCMVEKVPEVDQPIWSSCSIRIYQHI